MNIALWILAGLLAFAFLGAGMMKVRITPEQMAEKAPWAKTTGQVRAIGAAELLGALGLILPAALGIAPILTPIAALLLGLVMLGAVVVHLVRGDGMAGSTPSLVLGVLSLLLAVLRFGP